MERIGWRGGGGNCPWAAEEDNRAEMKEAKMREEERSERKRRWRTRRRSQMRGSLKASWRVTQRCETISWTDFEKRRA